MRVNHDYLEISLYELFCLIPIESRISLAIVSHCDKVGILGEIATPRGELLLNCLKKLAIPAHEVQEGSLGDRPKVEKSYRKQQPVSHTAIAV